MKDDRELVMIAAKEPEKGFRCLMAKYKDAVYWHIRRLVVVHEDAQDATQETFVRIFRSLSDFKGECSFRSWVYRIATNEALRLLNRYRDDRVSLNDSVDELNSLIADEYVDYSDLEVVKLQKSDGSGILVDPNVVTCSNDEVCAAIKDVYDENRSIVEPAGALAVAGMKKYIEEHNLQGKNCVAVLCGANMNFDRLRYIAERTEIGEKKEAIFGVTIPEKTGAFLAFCRSLKGRNITEFNYRYNANGDKSANIFVGIGLKEGQKERLAVYNLLTESGYQVVDLTDDEVAKTHVRYLIGGHASLPDEQLFRIEFPERPSALLNFLEKLGANFNISLFHYRNHGAAEGRILAGIQMGEKTAEQLQNTLQEIGYDCENITDNMGYKLFLQ